MYLLKMLLKEYKELLLIITIGVLAIYGIFIFTDHPFFVNNDQYTQYNISSFTVIVKKPCI